MISKIIASSALLATASANASDHWAFIVTGSNGFGNYRH